MEGEHEKIAKVVEKNKYVTTPMKEIESFYEAYCQERESVEEALQKLADISQNMGVLALGAAIEAGRMGEDGRKFVTGGRGSACERRAVYFGGCGCACEDQWF